MIPNTKDRALTSSGVAEAGTFGISMVDEAHIMNILRDTLYSDKVLAVLREYSANAWDAHRSVNKGDLPIKITMPTRMEPTLSIRDFGPGLSKDDVFKVYTQYGASTKRDSDSTVGMLGIGSKSAFAYSDSFTVTSWHGGKKRIYAAVLDETNKGIMNLLHEEDCGEETGVLVQMAVKPEDIYDFENTAKELFQYFQPRPTINLSIPPLPPSQASLKNGIIFDTKNEDWRRTDWVAVMGCVPYSIDLDQLKSTEEGIPDFITEMSGALYFDIGALQVSASREELKYDKTTKVKLIERLNALVEEYVRNTLDTIEKGGFTPWERRIRAQILRQMHLPIPDDIKDTLISASVDIEEKKPETIIVEQNKKFVSHISVSKETRLLLWDDRRRSTRGYRLSSYDYLVKPKDRGMSWDSVKETLESLCKVVGIEGVPIHKLSELPWNPPVTRSGRSIEVNPKHKVRAFKLAPERLSWSTHSKGWDIHSWEPSTDDVYVILERFEAKGFQLYSAYKEDNELAKFYSRQMPTVYGYKTTEKNPVTPETVTGTPYMEWRKKFVESLLTDEVKKDIEQWCWSVCIERHMWRSDKNDKEASDTLVMNLGPDHIITQFVKKYHEGKEYIEKKSGLDDVAKTLYHRTRDVLGESETAKQLTAIHEKYPLLSLPNVPLIDVWGDHSEKWTHYIKVIDQLP